MVMVMVMMVMVMVLVEEVEAGSVERRKCTVNLLVFASQSLDGELPTNSIYKRTRCSCR